MFSKKYGKPFCPNEIIFSVTNACNLSCKHCFVNQNSTKLNIEEATTFLDRVILSENFWNIERIGFSGGEPFLNLECVKTLCKKAIEHNLLFDRIITNAAWFSSKEILFQKLNELYESGFDGTIAISFDSFHGQKAEQIEDFIKITQELWNNPQMIELQSVLTPNEKPVFLHELSNILNAEFSYSFNKKTKRGRAFIQNENLFINAFLEHESFQSTNIRAWKSKKWFKEDFCEGPGNVLFVHSNGKIAPCCGFANENDFLCFASITDSPEKIVKQAEANPLINICYQKGLSSLIKPLKKSGILPNGKTDDICTFCDFISRHKQICSNFAKNP